MMTTTMIMMTTSGTNLRQLLSAGGERWLTEPYGEESRWCYRQAK